MSVFSHQEMATGVRVRLLPAPQGEAGLVKCVRRNRVVVAWPNLDFIGHHRPEQLLIVDSGGEGAARPADRIKGITRKHSVGEVAPRGRTARSAAPDQTPRNAGKTRPDNHRATANLHPRELLLDPHAGRHLSRRRRTPRRGFALRSDDGQTVVEVGAGEVTITAATVTVNASQNATVNAQQTATVQGQTVINLTGSQHVAITGAGQTTIEGKNFLKYVHSGVQSGGAVSGPVV